MSRDLLYCDECGARLNLYVVGVCSRCNFDLTGEDAERDAREARDGLRGSESPREGTEA
jgi:nitrogenase molybdenum-iron protein alpha/beta subunit